MPILEPAALGAGAAVLAGLAGSAHCFAMCGGMAGALGLRARRSASGALQAGTRALTYQLGRIGGYALAGALTGGLVASLGLVLDVARLGPWLRVGSGILLILIAGRLLWRSNPLAWLERLGASVWRLLQPLAGRQIGREDLGSALLLGLLWGWLPCGLAYSMLLLASLSGSALRGAAIMAAFGLGTLPSMLTSSLIAMRLRQTLQARWPRRLGAGLLTVFGLWMITAAILHASGAQLPGVFCAAPFT